MDEVVVMIGDLVRSRRIKNRKEIQLKLRRTLENINSDYGNEVLAPLMIVRGDEFEGAFDSVRSCFDAFMRVERSLYPNKLRGGIGIGTIDTEFSERVIEMDGTSFHRARKALEKVKGAKSGVFIHSSDPEFDEIFNMTSRLFWAIINGWTKRQREVTEYYLAQSSSERSPRYEEIAEHFGVSQPSISQILSKAHAREVKDAQFFLLEKISDLELREQEA